MKGTFIKTTDRETAKKLIECGFQQVSVSAGTWTFSNTPPQNFSFEEFDGKMAFTDILSI